LFEKVTTAINTQQQERHSFMFAACFSDWQAQKHFRLQKFINIFNYGRSKSAMSNPNDLLGQKSCRYLNQGRTFDDIL